MKATRVQQKQCRNEPLGGAIVLEGAESLAGGAHAARLACELVNDCAAIVRDFAHAPQTLLQSGRNAHDSAGGRVGRRRLDEKVQQPRAQRLNPLGVAALKIWVLRHEIFSCPSANVCRGELHTRQSATSDACRCFQRGG